MMVMAQSLFDTTTDQQANLLELIPVTPGAVVSKALLNLPACKVIAFSMDAGQSISEHRAPSVAAVHVLDGRLRFTVNGRACALAAHDLLVMPPNAPHHLDATEPTRFLLTLVKESQG